jgi:hypothetical protein
LVKTVISSLPNKRGEICEVIARCGFQWSSNLNIAEDICLDPAFLITLNAYSTAAYFRIIIESNPTRAAADEVVLPSDRKKLYTVYDLALK